MSKYLAEFIGTFFLVLTVALTGNPIAIGLSLMVMVYMGGHVSGGHYNPAVSTAAWMRGALPMMQLPFYIFFQVLGAAFAACTAYTLSGDNMVVAPGEGVSVTNTLLAEGLFTFALCSVVLATATAKKMEGNYIYGLAIGMTVTVGAFAVGGISGGAFNPAVGTGPILHDLTMGSASFSNLWMYWVGPLAGAVVAALLFRVMNPEDFA